MLSLTCSVCMEKFRSTKPPFVLNCGHSFCQSCISGFISADVNTRKCPNCQYYITHDSSNEIPKNYMLFQLMEEDGTESDQEENIVSAGICPTHEQEEMNKWCETCQVSICNLCSVTENDSIHPPTRCSVINGSFAIQVLRKSSLKLQQELNLAFTNLQIKLVKRKAKFDLDHKFLESKKENIESIIRNKETHETFFRTSESELLSWKQMVIEQLIRVQDSADVTEMMTSYEAQKKLKTEAWVWIENTLKAIPSCIKMPMQEILGISRMLYVVTTHSNKTLFGKVQIHDDYLLVSSFMEDLPSFNSKITELSNICNETKFKEQNVYIKFKGNGEAYEDICFINLYQNNDFARNFFLLCSGFEESIFKGRRMVISEDILISEGDEGSAWNPVLKSIDLETCPLKITEKGSVYAPYPEDKERQSHFAVKPMPNTGIFDNNRRVFGDMIYGLSVSNYIREYDQGVVITGCGVQIKY